MYKSGLLSLFAQAPFFTGLWAFPTVFGVDLALSTPLIFDIGVYYPSKGMSNNEVASLASSQHLCQGFGRLSQRGSQQEYIEFLKGQPLYKKDNIFEGIDTSWSRVKGGKAIEVILKSV